MRKSVFYFAQTSKYIGECEIKIMILSCHRKGFKTLTPVVAVTFFKVQRTEAVFLVMSNLSMNEL